MIKKDSIILFQGDSITDAGRIREFMDSNSIQGLGCGYCNYIASQILRDYPDKNLQFLNRGISGDRIVDLYARWKSDTLKLKPDILSILIGVNDSWYEFENQNGVELDRFETVYRMLLQYTKQKLPHVHLIICEPFILEIDNIANALSEDMKNRQQIVKRIAKEFNACFVPYQSALNKCLLKAPANYWTVDGVHPTPAGHRILAEVWLNSVLNNE